METLVGIVQRCLLVFTVAVLFFYALGSHGLSQSQVLKNFLRERRFGFGKIVSVQQWSPPDVSLESLVESLDSFRDNTQEQDLIQALPGQPRNVGFKQYGGHITVDAKAGRALYYYFVEATEEPQKKPLVLWLNGGPGCSSLGYGAMAELGPFRVNPNGKTLHANPFAWNQLANVVFLESPAGVGFSYSNTTTDYDSCGDRKTAADNYKFLLSWFERFPRYKKRDFYVAGESYAGHYIPQLASTILKYRSPRTSFINLKGVMIGNSVTNDPTDNKGYIEYLWSHALISDQAYEEYMKYCNFSFYSESSFKCNGLGNQVTREMGNIDAYNIYYPLCNYDSSTNLPYANTAAPGEHGNGLNGLYDPCTEDYITSYLNIPEVQNALRGKITPNPVDWQLCSDIIYYGYESPTTLPQYREMMAAGLRVLVYSGDLDSVVSVTGTRLSLNALKVPIEKPWYPWISRENDVGGYSIVYKNGLTFATVRGAGHEVPSYQPARAFAMAKYFLTGQRLPSAHGE